MALLDVRDLKIAFYDTTPPTEVVKGISFSLEEGETLGIVGESGSGKSTLLNMIGALDTPMREGDHAPHMAKQITETEKEAIIRLLA